ncbi:MAG: RsmE family RNA methyltransferase [Sediminibacterium sp.]|nr:RsmE family RNA methyltransferase [Sediminibacterium sp.]
MTSAAPHIYINLSFDNCTQIILEKEKFHYCCKVLRKKKGDEVCIINGCGLELNTVVDFVDLKNQLVFLHINNKFVHKINGNYIWMGIPLLHQPARWEFMIEKLVEIGVHKLTPIITENTGFYKFNQTRTDHIIISALEQSRQFYKPQFDLPIKFSDFFNLELPNLKLIAYCSPGSKQHIKETAISEKICLVIGPEGDFSKAEINLALLNGFKGISLGDQRLRSETAAIKALVGLQQQSSS